MQAVDEGLTEDVPTGMFALPPGARTGDCLHKILEQFDFASGADDISSKALVKQYLEAYGLSEEEHALAVGDMLERLRHVPLDPGNPGFTLSRIPMAQRLTELEFLFPVRHLDGARLLNWIRSPHSFSASVVPRDSATDSRIAGFLKGFIDLIFLFESRYYIVDWKSNRLGSRIEDYNQEAMKRAITESCYDIHLYIAALDKYLRARLRDYDYEKHFGGVCYVFLRGVTPHRPDLGVYRDRPSAPAIARLSSLLGALAEVKP